MTVRVGLLYRLIEEVRRYPGSSISKLVIVGIWPNSRNPIDDPAQYIAAETNTSLEYDEQGNPRFMPKDSVEAEKIRASFRAKGLDDRPFDRHGNMKACG